jgi:hypothetical protein
LVSHLVYFFLSKGQREVAYNWTSFNIRVSGKKKQIPKLNFNGSSNFKAIVKQKGKKPRVIINLRLIGFLVNTMKLRIYRDNTSISCSMKRVRKL